MRPTRELWPGAALALGAAALFGASTPLAKALLGAVSPWLLAGLLYLGSGIGLAAVAPFRRRAQEAPLRRADLPWLAAIVLAGGVVGPVLLMLGLAATPASSASLLLNLEGVLTLAIAWVVFRENVDLRIGIGAAAILGGAVLLSWDGPVGGLGAGTLAIAGACLAWAIDNNLTRKLSSADPLQIAAIKGLAAGSVNVTLALLLHARWPGAGAVAAAGLVGFLGYGVSLACFVLALRHLGTARTAAYFSAAPFVGAVIAILLFGEAATPVFFAAAALMAVGLYLHLSERHEHEHGHEPAEHEHRHSHDAHHRHTHRPGDPAGEPHTHTHAHPRLVHSHPHFPDIHHRHPH
jgi:drug/metabolite transporter (DMT)-like permease